MKKISNFIIYLWLAVVVLSCKPTQIAQSPENNKITFQILQLNDVYEIAPLQAGKVAGMARVATVRDELLTKNQNLITVLAGDFLSPSLIGTLKDESTGERIQGLQMIDALNTIGMDYVTFGNHEFDNSLEALQKALNASEFEWVSSNVSQKHQDGTISPFKKNKQGKSSEVPAYLIHEFTNEQGKKLNLGIIGVTLPFNKAPYVHYEDEFESARKIYNQIKDKTDLVVIISHLELEDDKKLSAQMPEVPLIMGGHDHDNMKIQVGQNYITKADANAKTVYIHTFEYDFLTKTWQLSSELKELNEQIAFQEKTDKIVKKWQEKANQSMEALGYQPEAVVFSTEALLDGRESSVRYKPTLLGSTIANSILKAAPTAQVALLNSGSIRIDDQLTGDITETDILRILPFGGGIRQIQMKGKELEKVLEIGLFENRGIGGYLQYAGLTQAKDKRWYVGKDLLEAEKTYQIVLPGFLAEGREANLGFLKEYPSQEIDTKKNIGTINDIRHILIHYLKNHPFPKK